MTSMISRATVLILAALMPLNTAAAAKPHVVVVMWDATRPDHLTPYGYSRDTTPNLAKLAGEGTVFRKAQSTAPWTVPSVAGVFTGLFSHNHKVDYEATGYTLDLTTDAHTMAEAMSDNGYATALYTAQGIYYKQAGFTQGFDSSKFTKPETLVDLALGHIKANKAQPTFTVVYWLDPHAPYEPAPEHDKWSDPAVDVNIHSGGKERPGFLKHGAINRGKVDLTAAQMAQLQNKYDGELHANDAELGRLWKGLQDMGIADDTVFVFTSDHGEGFGEHSRQKVWHDIPYDTVLDVPLVVRAPGVGAGKTVDAAVRTIDIYPTLMELTGGTAKHPLNGESLVSMMKSGSGADRVNVGTSHWHDGLAFVRTPQHKLLFSRNNAERAELFDLGADPGEQSNLAANAELLAKLKAKRDEVLQQTSISIGSGGAEAVGDDETARLCALGYLDGPECE